MLARHFLDAGDEPQALQSFQRCFEILDAFARAGRPMDEQMRAVHQQLSHMFGNPTAG